MKNYPFYFTDQPVPNYGPEVTSDLSQNHNYIAYLFVFQYTHWDKIMSGMVEDQCRYVFVLTLSQPVKTFVVCSLQLLIFIYLFSNLLTGTES